MEIVDDIPHTLQVDFGFAATGYAVNQVRAEAITGSQGCKRPLLVVVEGQAVCDRSRQRFIEVDGACIEACDVTFLEQCGRRTPPVG